MTFVLSKGRAIFCSSSACLTIFFWKLAILCYMRYHATLDWDPPFEVIVVCVFVEGLACTTHVEPFSLVVYGYRCLICVCFVAV